MTTKRCFGAAAGVAALLSTWASAAPAGEAPARRAVAVITGVAGPGRLEARRAEGPAAGTFAAAGAGLRLCSGDAVRATSGEVDLGLLNLDKGSLVTTRVAPGALRTAADLLATQEGSVLAALARGVVGLFTGPARGVERLGGAQAGAVNAPTEHGFGRASEEVLAAKADEEPRGTDDLAFLEEEPPAAGGGDDGGGDASFDGDEGSGNLAERLSDRMDRRLTHPDEQQPDERGRPVGPDPEPPAPEVTVSCDGRAVPLRALRLRLPCGADDGAAEVVVLDLRPSPPSELCRLPVVVEGGTAAFPLGLDTFGVPYGTRVGLRLQREGQLLPGSARWFVVVSPERLKELKGAVRGALTDGSPQRRRALLLVAAEGLTELGALRAAAEVYARLGREPDLSPCDREAFRSAFEACRAALGD